MADYEYVCPNAGHEGKREFIAADPGWYARHELDAPVSCPPCRDLIRNLRDEKWQCAGCGRRRTYTATYKEAFHRSQGKFALSEVCDEACAKRLQQQQAAERRRLEAEQRRAIKQRAKVERNTLATAFAAVQPSPWPEVQDEVLEVDEVVDFKDLPGGFVLPDFKLNLKLSPDQRQHIERHLPALGGTRSRSALVGAQASLDDMIDAIGWAVEQTGLPKRVFWKPEDERYICLTEVEDGRIEVTILAVRRRMFLANQFELVTSFDGVKLKYITDRLADGTWAG